MSNFCQCLNRIKNSLLRILCATKNHEQHYNFSNAEKWHEHKSLTLGEDEIVTVLRDFSIHTERTILANRSNIIRLQKACGNSDMAIKSNNISAKE